MSDVEQRITIELNPREQRLYDQLRARVVDAPPGAASSLRDLMLLVPDLTVMLARLLRDARVPRGSKLVALVGLGYVLSPIDLVPALIFGPIGLVDDLIVALGDVVASGEPRAPGRRARRVARSGRCARGDPGAGLVVRGHLRRAPAPRVARPVARRPTRRALGAGRSCGA